MGVDLTTGAASPRKPLLPHREIKYEQPHFWYTCSMMLSVCCQNAVCCLHAGTERGYGATSRGKRFAARRQCQLH
eukprot:322721-Rhodomonas_salina.1